jgi:hypothetical protein
MLLSLLRKQFHLNVWSKNAYFIQEESTTLSFPYKAGLLKTGSASGPYEPDEAPPRFSQ